MDSGKPQKQALAIAYATKRRKKMAKGGPVQGTMEHRNEPSVDLHRDTAKQGMTTEPGKGDVWPDGKEGNHDLVASKERSSYGDERTQCEHGSEYDTCPEAHDYEADDGQGEVMERYAYGGLIEMNTDMDENDYDDGHGLDLAKRIMQRKAVQKEKDAYSINGEINYANGGMVGDEPEDGLYRGKKNSYNEGSKKTGGNNYPEGGTMSGKAAADDGSERTPGRGDNTQRDGVMRPENEMQDENGLVDYSDSDHEQDDFLSQDGSGSLFTGNSVDNEDFDEDYDKDRRYADGGMVANLKEDYDDEKSRKKSRMSRIMKRR